MYKFQLYVHFSVPTKMKSFELIQQISYILYLCWDYILGNTFVFDSSKSSNKILIM